MPCRVAHGCVCCQEEQGFQEGVSSRERHSRSWSGGYEERRQRNREEADRYTPGVERFNFHLPAWSPCPIDHSRQMRSDRARTSFLQCMPASLWGAWRAHGSQWGSGVRTVTPSFILSSSAVAHIQDSSWRVIDTDYTPPHPTKVTWLTAEQMGKKCYTEVLLNINLHGTNVQAVLNDHVFILFFVHLTVILLFYHYQWS